MKTKYTLYLTSFVVFLLFLQLTSRGQTYQKISSSANGFGFASEETRPLSYNKDLGTILFVHRKSPAWTGFTDANSGSMQGTWTRNYGATWDSTIFWTDGVNLGRYPSGVIANQNGNINLNNALISGTGSTNTVSGWSGSWFSSGTFTSGAIQNQGEQFVPLQLPSAGALTLSQMSFTRSNMINVNGNVYVLGKLCNNVNGTTDFGFRGVALIKGTKSGSNMTWSLVDSIIPNVAVNTLGERLIFSDVKLGFSPNGQTAYIVMFGVDAAATPGSSSFGYQPMVYKSTSGGTAGSWQRVLGNYNWNGNHSQLANNVAPTNASVVVPYFSPYQGCDISVDNNGKLHLLTLLNGTATSNIDSLNFIFRHNYDLNQGYLTDYIWHMFTDGNSCWSVSMIDSMRSGENYDYSAIWPWVDGTPHHRLSISRNSTGNIMSFSWVDDYNNTDGYYSMIAPDLFLKGYNTGNNLYTPTKQITNRQDVAWQYMAADMIENYPAAGDFTSPGVFGIPQNNNLNSQMDYYYINNAKFNSSELNQNILTTSAPGCIFLLTSQTNETCNGLSNGTATVTASGGSGPYTYSWNTSPIQTTATATGLTAGNYAVTVTDQNSNSSVASITIITQAPYITNPASISTCSGNQLNINLTASVPSTYTWQAANNPNTTGEGTGLQSTSLINNTIINNTSVAQTVTYTITPTGISGGCVGTPFIMNVTVYPKPQMTSLSTSTICSGDAVNLNLNATLPSTFNWVAANNLNTTGESTTAQIGNSITDAINNSTSSPQVVAYIVTPISNAGSCAGPNQQVNISVNPTPAAIITPSGNINSCQGTPVLLTASQGDSYSWWRSDIGYFSSSQSVSINSLTNISVAATVTENGCTGYSQNVNINIIPNNANITITASPQFGAAPLNTAFNNSTPNRTNFTYLWTFGDGLTSTSNAATVFHTYTYPGLYDVTLVATSIATGCTDTLIQQGYIMVTGSGGCTHTASVSPSGNVNICSGSSATLSCNTNSAFTYQWNYNGVAISGANSSTFNATQAGFYSVTILQNGCPVTSAATQVNMNPSPVPPTISASGSIVPCVGGTVTLSASGISGGTYQWSNGINGASINVTSSGTFFVTGTDPSTGCSSQSASYSVNASSAPAPNICMVTVDSLSQFNVIIWDKTNYSVTDTFVVYRDISNNNYQRIGKVPFDSLSQFIDTVVSLYPANGNPNVSSWRYKISVIDNCGIESPKSPYHQTMFMQSSVGNFSWNHYQIEGQPTPVTNLQNYLFLRDNLSNGNWTPIQTLSASSTAYTDPAYATYPTGSWRVETIWNLNCTPIRSTINTTRSNIKSGSLVTGAQSGLNNNELSLNVYPNPNNGDFILMFDSKESTIANLEIVNLLGQIVTFKSIQINKLTNSIPISLTTNGIYIVKLSSNGFVGQTRIVVQK